MSKPKSPATNGRRPLATAEELAEYVGLPLETIYNWRKKRAGPRGFRVGRWLRYRWEDIDAWLAEQERKAS